MMGNRGFADLEMVRNGAGREIAGVEQLEDFPTGRIIEGFKQRIHNLDN